MKGGDIDVGSKSELKMMARLAKARLKSGYWVDRKEKLKACLAACGGNALAVDEVKQYFVASKVYQRKMTEEECREKALYPVVCDIIESGEGLNPLGRLIDRNYYESLDYPGKQRYVLELSELYKKLASKYQSEKEIERRLNTLARM